MDKSLTNRQIALIVYSSVFAYGIISLPKDVGEIAGTGSWFSIVIATAIFSVMVYIITYLQYVFEGKTLYEYSKLLVGKFITNIIVVAIIIYTYLFFTMVVRMYAEIIKMIFLIKTPIVAICILFYIVAGYAIVKGINSIARLCEIYCVINILGFIFMISVLATKGKMINIQPLFFKDDFIKYIKAVSTIIFPFIGIDVLYFLPISRYENRKIFKYNTLIIWLVGIMYIFIVEVCISVVGVDAIAFYKMPLFSIIKGVDIHSLEMLRRLDGICIFFWSLNIISSICISGYGILTYTQKILKNNNKFIIAVLIITGLMTAQLPKTVEQLDFIIKYNSYFGLVVTTILPVILFIITKVKKYDKYI